MHKRNPLLITRRLILQAFTSLLALFFITQQMSADLPGAVHLSPAGDWTVKVRLATPSLGEKETLIQVPPPAFVTVNGERHDSLPLFSSKAAGWGKGVGLRALRAQETTTPFLLDPSSLIIRAGPETDAESYRLGEDFDADLQWGTLGRLPKGRIREAQAVFISYRYVPLRLDAVVLTGAGAIILRTGEPCASSPKQPRVAAEERHLGNVWIPGKIAALKSDNLFPILEPAFPEPPRPAVTAAESFAPRALQKLRSGDPLRILAWGDSVTDGGYLPQAENQRWQAQFVQQLRARFPKAKIELQTEAWGGRNSDSYLKEPSGSPHNYREKVLAAKPDLIVSEFVNDGGLSPAEVEIRYAKFLADFTQIGAEWIILTPHYVRPDMMGLNRERDIDDDPRPYVAGLREFGVRHNVAVADASRRYGRLWRQGIPYTTLLLNSINHPDASGMKIFADALIELFP